MAAAALVGLTPTTNPVPEQVVSCLLVSKAQVKSACKAFLRKQIASRHVPWETLRPRPACDTVVITAASSAALPWRCQLCPSAFADRRRLAVHESVHHGRRTQHAISAVGSRCEVCTREYSICGAVRVACGSTQKRKYRVSQRHTADMPRHGGHAFSHMGRALGGPRLILEGCSSFLTYQFSLSGRPVRWPCLICFQLSRPRCAGKRAFPLHVELSLRDQHISAR